MPDNELKAFVNLPICYQRAWRLNYHAHNDGSNEEAPEEDHVFKKLQLTSQSTIDGFASYGLTAYLTRRLCKPSTTESIYNWFILIRYLPSLWTFFKLTN
jgi:hypothetical protein